MSASPFVKTATIASFILLLSAFVAYRAGAFSDMLNGKKTPSDQTNSPSNGLRAISAPVDSPPPKTVVFPGSKSAGIISAEDLGLTPDSAATAAEDSVSQEELRLLSGPKSGLIFEPPADTVKKVKRKKRKD